MFKKTQNIKTLNTKTILHTSLVCAPSRLPIHGTNMEVLLVAHKRMYTWCASECLNMPYSEGESACTLCPVLVATYCPGDWVASAGAMTATTYSVRHPAECADCSQHGPSSGTQTSIAHWQSHRSTKNGRSDAGV
jgi:hypothetical protein